MRYQIRFSKFVTITLLSLISLLLIGTKKAEAAVTSVMPNMPSSDFVNSDNGTQLSDVHLFAARAGATLRLDAPTSEVKIYFTSSSGTITIIDGNFCGNDVGGIDSLSYNSTGNTRFRLYRADGGENQLATFTEVNNGTNCSNRNLSLAVSGLTRSNVSGHTQYYVAHFQAFKSDATQGINAYRISAGAGNLISYYAGSGNQFALGQAWIRPAGRFGDYRFQFAPTCAMKSDSIATLNWFDADAGVANQTRTVVTDLREQNLSGAWSTIATFNLTGGDGQPGSRSFTAKPGHKYEWIVHNIESVNGVQFQLPFDSINFTGAGGCTIQGRVFDHPDQLSSGGISGVGLEICDNDGSPDVTTDGNGNFAFILPYGRSFCLRIVTSPPSGVSGPNIRPWSEAYGNATDNCPGFGSNDTSPLVGTNNYCAQATYEYQLAGRDVANPPCASVNYCRYDRYNDGGFDFVYYGASGSSFSCPGIDGAGIDINPRVQFNTVVAPEIPASFNEAYPDNDGDGISGRTLYWVATKDDTKTTHQISSIVFAVGTATGVTLSYPVPGSDYTHNDNSNADHGILLNYTKAFTDYPYDTQLPTVTYSVENTYNMQLWVSYADPDDGGTNGQATRAGSFYVDTVNDVHSSPGPQLGPCHARTYETTGVTSPNAQLISGLAPDQEDPTSATFSATVNVKFGVDHDPAAGIGTVAERSKVNLPFEMIYYIDRGVGADGPQTSATGMVLVTANDNNRESTGSASASYSLSISVPGTVVAGDRFCWVLYITRADEVASQAKGRMRVDGSIIDGSLRSNSTSAGCSTADFHPSPYVVDRPYVRIYGGDALAGASFTRPTGQCTPSGDASLLGFVRLESGGGGGGGGGPINEGDFFATYSSKEYASWYASFSAGATSGNNPSGTSWAPFWNWLKFYKADKGVNPDSKRYNDFKNWAEAVIDFLADPASVDTSDAIMNYNSFRIVYTKTEYDKWYASFSAGATSGNNPSGTSWAPFWNWLEYFKIDSNGKIPKNKDFSKFDDWAEEVIKEIGGNPSKFTIAGSSGGGAVTPAGYRGAGVQMAAFAIAQIVDFPSAVNRTVAPGAPKGLTFANFGVGAAGSTFGGGWGTGNFTCAPSYFAAHGSDPITTGNVTITGHSLGLGSVPEKHYVDGDVIIDGNVTYAVGNYNDPRMIPSFVVVVRGNIYITNGTSAIDGVLIAEPQYDGSGNPIAGTGRIYTCAFNRATPRPTNAEIAGGSCGNKLTITGAVIAEQIKFLRAHKSLRDSTVGETSGGNMAETIVFSPEVWIRSMGLNPPAGRGDYDAIINLPPVL